MAYITVESDTASLNVELLPDGRVRHGDAVFTLDELRHGEWRVAADGRAIRVWAAGTRENLWVYAEGVVYRLAAGSGGARGQRRDESASLSAPMPATVRAVLVEAGQTVARGETVVILEAMKMELPVRAPHDGVLKTIACQPGELVQPGTPLLEMQ